MKNALVCLFLLGFLATGQAQVIQLEETKVKAPGAVLVKGESSLEIKISESYAGQFASNPLRFVKENFDMKSYINGSDEKHDSYQVTFKNNKGSLEAIYDEKGDLVQTSQRFKNVLIPMAMRRDLITHHKGWNMTGNSYSAYGKKDLLDKEEYKISLSDGKKNKNIKIKNDLKLARRVASN